MRLLLILLTAALGIGVAACDQDESDEAGEEADEDEDKGPQSDPRTLVELAPVVVGSVGDHLVTSGTVEAEAQADLVPEISGTVVRLAVEEGDPVRRGQLLATLSSPNLEANKVRAEAELARAKKDHAEVDRLFAQGVISQRELDESQYRLESARTAHEEALLMFARTRITSPIAGTVSIRDLRLGEVAGGRRAFQVVDLSRMRVVVKVPEKDLSRLGTGQKATLRSAYDEETTVAGEVVRIAPTVDPKTGTVRVTVELDRDQSVLRPGQFVGVRIEVGRHDDVLIIPRRALTWQDGKPLAYRVRIEEPPPPEEPEEDDEDEDGDDEEVEIPGPYRIARQVDLVLGFQDDLVVEIAEGLDLADEVVVNGGASLRDEARVRTPEDPTIGEEDPEEAAVEAEAPEAEAEG